MDLLFVEVKGEVSSRSISYNFISRNPNKFQLQIFLKFKLIFFSSLRGKKKEPAQPKHYMLHLTIITNLKKAIKIK